MTIRVAHAFTHTAMTYTTAQYLPPFQLPMSFCMDYSIDDDFVNTATQSVPNVYASINWIVHCSKSVALSFIMCFLS